MRSMLPYRRNSVASPIAHGLFSDDFFGPFFSLGESFGTSSFRVDIKEKAEHYEINAELPGVNQDQIEITVDDGLLTIAANINSEKKQEQEGYIYSERRSGRFQRSFNLDSSCVKEDEISARYENGILSVVVPKTKECTKKPQRHIEIQ